MDITEKQETIERGKIKVEFPYRVRWIYLDFECPKCGEMGIASIYLPMCTNCANKERGT